MRSLWVSRVKGQMVLYNFEKTVACNLLKKTHLAHGPSCSHLVNVLFRSQMAAFFSTTTSFKQLSLVFAKRDLACFG